MQRAVGTGKAERRPATGRESAKPSLPQLLLGGAVAAFALASRCGRAPAPAGGGDPERQAARAAQADPDRPGRHAEHPAAIPPRGWWAVLRRVWDENNKDNMTIVAAGCAFYAMLALFPAITALVSIYGLVADPQQVEQQVGAMQGVLPEEAASLIATQAHAVAGGTSGALGWGAALAIAFALWTAASGVKTLFTALNIAYEEEETRGLIRFNLDALLFTFLMIVGVVVGLGVIVILPAALDYLPLGPLAGWAVRIGSWAVLLGFLLVGLAAIYRFGPSRAKARWRWVTPGSLTAAALWLAVSAVFSFYVANFDSYNETYGALGGVIILLMWLYISAFVVLLGAELNAELELQTERDTTTGLPRPMGQRRAYAADHTVETRRR
jgi:membrane protein